MNTDHLRNLALAGVIGAAIMLVGDFLFFLTPWVSGANFDSIEAMQTMTPQRLIWGGVVGPISGLAYGLGSCLFYFALKDHGRKLAIIIAGAFILTYALAGAAHCLFTVHGFADAGELGQVRSAVIQMIDTMAAIIVVAALLGTAAFIYMILRYKTVFPKWIILITPVTLSLFKPALTPFVPSPFGSVIIGGWANWSALIFFSVLAIWWHTKGQVQRERPNRQ